MYGEGSGNQSGVLGGVTSTTAGVAVLPNTGGSEILTIVAVTAIVLGCAAIIMQLVVNSYRRTALK